MDHRCRIMLILLLLAASLHAQPRAAGFSEMGQKALDMVGQEDREGALKLLESRREDPSTTEVDLALLGALYVEVGRPADALEVLDPIAARSEADPAVLYNAGRAALRAGQKEKGVRYLERSLAISPGSPAARELGLYRGAEGRPMECFRHLRAWGARSPADQQARVAGAACALRIERPDDAAILLDGLPVEPRVQLLRGQMLLQKHDAQGGVAVLEPLLESHPPEMEADLFRLTADAYIQVGRVEDAIELLEGWGRKDPRAGLLLAEAQYRNGDLEASAATLAPIAGPQLSRSGGMPPGARALVVRDYGRALVGLGRHGEALPYLELATELLPKDSLGWKSLGEAQRGLGNREEAMAALTRFKELAEKESERRRRLERAGDDPVQKALVSVNEALAAGQGDRAVIRLKQEVALAPKEPRLVLMLVNTLLTLERNEEALSVSKSAAQSFPDVPDVLYQHAVVLMSNNQSIAAVAEFRRALELDPNHVATMNDLAVLLLLRGEKDEARSLLQRVLEIRPDDGNARRNLEGIQ